MLFRPLGESVWVSGHDAYSGPRFSMKALGTWKQGRRWKQFKLLKKECSWKDLKMKKHNDVNLGQIKDNLKRIKSKRYKGQIRDHRSCAGPFDCVPHKKPFIFCKIPSMPVTDPSGEKTGIKSCNNFGLWLLSPILQLFNLVLLMTKISGS